MHRQVLYTCVVYSNEINLCSKSFIGFSCLADWNIVMRQQANKYKDRFLKKICC